MPKNVVSYKFVSGTNGYISDLNQDLSIKARFVAPPDLDGIAIGVIVAAVGGTINVDPAPCSDSDLITPRKLEFIRQSGNTMSVAFSDRTDVVGVATAIKNVLDGANNGANPVVCIKLRGEDFPNLNDELGVTYDGTTFATSHKAPATALKQNYCTGLITYESDATNPFGTSVVQPIRSITEKSTNDFAAQLGTTPATCIGTFLSLQNCGNGRRNPRKHRRFVLSFATKVDPTDGTEAAATETIELPTSGGGALDILACANAAAALTGLYCIGYKGEYYDRVHKIL